VHYFDSYWTRRWRKMWKYYQSHPKEPFSYGMWDAFPGKPEIQSAHAKWLSLYAITRVLVPIFGAVCRWHVNRRNQYDLCVPRRVIVCIRMMNCIDGVNQRGISMGQSACSAIGGKKRIVGPPLSALFASPHPCLLEIFKNAAILVMNVEYAGFSGINEMG
jgi:hypothetical protein